MNLLITMLSQISLDTNSQDQLPKFEIDMPLWFVLHSFKMDLSKTKIYSLPIITSNIRV